MTPPLAAGVRVVVADVEGTLVTPDKVVTPLTHMANANVDVRRAATFVTSSNTEEGFALAMERRVLPRGHRKPQMPDRIAPRSVAELS